MWLNPQVSADLVTFTEEILNGKISFFVQYNILGCVQKVWNFSTKFSYSDQCAAETFSHPYP